MKRVLILAAATMLTLPAHAISVLTSVKPIQMIVSELTDGITQPQVLLQSNASPHDYALRPSDVRNIASADLVIWYGHDLEPFLEKVMAERSNTFTLSNIPGLALRAYDTEHNHDGHDHGSHDPHFWLGVEPVKQVALAVANKLAEVDPVNADQYEVNLAKFEEQLNVTDAKIEQQLAPIQDKGYFVFHDAYGYFEEHFGMNNLGHFTVTPDRKPGAKTLIHIRKALAAGDVECVFSEPQFTPAVVESVLRGSDVSNGTLDPLGSDIEVRSGSYFVLLQNMANSFSQCLGKP
ncbi:MULTISPECIES: zinc ABC transporter substrate-binding protein ZnuA [Vibrio]|uniref:zinc ABC transporter substrate-binding protein ZnuA n=1 Tax=Vibrio TaxID=662 RepID=UPI000BFFF09A|nr:MULTISPECIES: zinc ABC transporter substrate-binding protein ZnuA [unclassified Vibrio]PHJ42030.1 zinc ABC transporter substrate-binding protein [Vibrio sp. PID17_43]RIZ55959.1 zinc ABC transporter substrate-binding protein [Vibrio sp. PID23_8]